MVSMTPDYTPNLGLKNCAQCLPPEFGKGIELEKIAPYIRVQGKFSYLHHLLLITFELDVYAIFAQTIDRCKNVGTWTKSDCC